MPPLRHALRSAVQRVEREAVLWRTEPIRRVAVRNRPLHPLRVRQFHSFGAHSFVDRPTWLYGTKHIAIGEGVMILKGGWVAVEREGWEKGGVILDIGDRAGFRVGCTISAASSVIIEADVGAGANVTIVDSKHTWAGGHVNALYNPIEAAPIRIGRGTWLADGATVAAGADIGEQCAIGSNSVVGSKVPDYSIVIGNPGRVVGSTRS